MLPADDPTIPDRLILRSLIEDGLPARAAALKWPVREPFEIAQIIFDPLFRAPYDLHVPEPVFEHLPAAMVPRALGIALGLMKADYLAIFELRDLSKTLRA